jgi:hypothetical protein
MNRRRVFSAAVFAMAGLVSKLKPAWAQEKRLKERLIGTWSLVSVTATRPDGSRQQPFGTDEGILMFDENGHYSLQLCKRGRPKFASNNRMKGTPEEYQATVQGCKTLWGHYTVDEAAQALILKIEHAMFPNWEGTEQTISIQFIGDELRYVTPAAAAGGTAELIWRVAK